MLPKQNLNQNVAKKMFQIFFSFRFGDFFIPKKMGIDNIIFLKFHNCATKNNVCSEFHSQKIPLLFPAFLIGLATPPPPPKYISKLSGEGNGAAGQWA
jgi:hypothetical protein